MTERPPQYRYVRRRRRRSRGQSLVEFALVSPIFLLILSGIMDFGFLLYSRMTVINAAREGARIATTMTDTPGAIPGAVDTRANAAASPLSVTTVTTCVPKSGGCSFSANGLEFGDSINVRVSYVHHAFFPLLFGAEIPLSSSVQMVLE
jgi:hypothetical protein